MPPRIETGVIKKLHEFYAQNEPVLESARRLEREFPGAVALFLKDLLYFMKRII
jgi:hypothetical protein